MTFSGSPASGPFTFESKRGQAFTYRVKFSHLASNRKYNILLLKVIRINGDLKIYDVNHSK